MAQSRLQKIGTIFSRVTDLMKGKVLPYEERPLWYDVYEAFPPKIEPRYDRQKPNIPIKQIFYKEDVVRARFHKDLPSLSRNNLFENQPTVSPTKKMIFEYNKQLKLGLSEEEAYKEALANVKAMRNAAPHQEPKLAETKFEKPIIQKEPQKPIADVKIADLFTKE